MFRDIGPSALLSPCPAVMVSCRGRDGEYAKDNIITVAWAGIVCTSPPMVGISLRPERFSYTQIIQSGEFAVNLVGEELLRACDFCGVRSGRDTDKFGECSLTAVRTSLLEHASVIGQAPAVLCCKLRSVNPLGSHTQLIGEITAVLAKEELVDEKGALHLEKAGLIAYSHGDYCRLGRKLGFFGYSVASEKVLRRRMGDKG